MCVWWQTRATSKLRVLVLGLIDEACAGILVDAIGTKGACPQLQTLELRDLKPEGMSSALSI